MELPVRDPSLDRLDALLGEWETEATHPFIDGVVKGEARFEWMEGRAFLIWRTHQSRRNTVPEGISVIGASETPGEWLAHYFDERGVARVYRVSLDGGVWRMWRDDPDFPQRMMGRFEDGGRTVRASWEVQEGGPWKSDLQMTYRRKNG